MGLSKDQVLAALATITDQSTGADLVASGAVRKVAACDAHVSVTVACPDHDQAREHLRAGVETVVRRAAARLGESVDQVAVRFVEPSPDHEPIRFAGGSAPTEAGDANAAASDAQPTVDQPRDVPLKQASSSKTVSEGSAAAGSSSGAVARHVIAVGAGKGGVGKSTVAVTLALSLARAGHSVGLLDGDIYGPSTPTLLGLDAEDVVVRDNMLQTFHVHGIRAMTIGKLVDPEKPLIWRGPMAHGAFKQLAEQTHWGELDYLIVDLPPGTGDVPLTMSQMMKLTGAVIVCTPQKVAQDDAVRAARMFQQLSIEVLGVVENMSFFIGDDGKEYDIFGRGGAEQMAQRLGLPFLGALPINMQMRDALDRGKPLECFTDAGDQIKRAIEHLAKRVEDEVALASMRSGSGGPVLNVS